MNESRTLIFPEACSAPNKVDPNRQHAMKHENIFPNGTVKEPAAAADENRGLPKIAAYRII